MKYYLIREKSEKGKVKEFNNINCQFFSGQERETEVETKKLSPQPKVNSYLPTDNNKINRFVNN